MGKLAVDSRAPKVRGFHDSYVAGYNKGYARGMKVMSTLHEIPMRFSFVIMSRSMRLRGLCDARRLHGMEDNHRRQTQYIPTI
jgi:hypothetical protein